MNIKNVSPCGNSSVYDASSRADDEKKQQRQAERESARAGWTRIFTCPPREIRFNGVNFKKLPCREIARSFAAPGRMKSGLAGSRWAKLLGVIFVKDPGAR